MPATAAGGIAASLAEDEGGLRAILYAALDSCQETVMDVYPDTGDIGDYTVSQLIQVFHELISDGELFWVKTSISYSYYQDAENVGDCHLAQVGFTYVFTADELPAARERVEAKVASALSWTSDDMADVEKLQAVHDYLVRSCAYDQEGVDAGNESWNTHTAYGALVDGLAVCQGYGAAYDLVLGRLDIPCTVVIGNDGNHGWNMVELDGIWYYVDVTWDDPVPDQGFDAAVLHTFFLRSDESMASLGHYGWTAENPAPEDWAFAGDLPVYDGPVSGGSGESGEPVLTPGWTQFGTCEWQFVDGVLTFRPLGDGTRGVLDDTQFNNWRDLDAAVTKVVVMPGVVAGTSLRCMFQGYKTLTEVDLSGLDTSATTLMDNMFQGCSDLEKIDVAAWNTTELASIDYMFDGCTSLKALDMSGWDVGGLTTLTCVFNGCSSLEQIDVSGWDVSQVWSMSGLFAGCSSMAAFDLSIWRTPSLRSTCDMFNGCTQAVSINLSGLDLSQVEDMTRMFYECNSLADVPAGFTVPAGADASLCFYVAQGMQDIRYDGDDASVVSYDFRANNRNLVRDRADAAHDMAFASVVVLNDDAVYTGAIQYPQIRVTMGETVLVEGVDYRVLCDGRTKAGDIPFTVQGLNVYGGSTASTFTIAPAPVDQLDIAPVPDQVATGSPLEPALEVTFGGAALEEGRDYTVRYERNVEPGTASATLAGAGDFSGEVEVPFAVVAPAPAAGPFPDTPADAWYVTGGYLGYVLSNGIMQGYDSGYFGPHHTLTRAQAATVLYRLATGGSGAGGASSFPDVPAGAYYTAAVEWCRQAGVVTGYATSGLFGPNDPVTREQLAVMAYRFAGLYGAASPAGSIASFPDAGLVDGWAVEAMSWCNAVGLVTGKSDTGMLDPLEFATRCQMAKIVTVLTRDVIGGRQMTWAPGPEAQGQDGEPAGPDAPAEGAPAAEDPAAEPGEDEPDAEPGGAAVEGAPGEPEPGPALPGEGGEAEPAPALPDPPVEDGASDQEAPGASEPSPDASSQ